MTKVNNVEHLFNDILRKYVVMDTFSVMWGTEQTNIFLVPGFPCWERAGEWINEREEWGGEGEGEGAKGGKNRGREPERGRRQGQGDRPTDQQGWKHKFHPSEEVIMIITKSSYYHHTSILIVMFLILHISDYGLIDHWSSKGRLTISH